MRLSNRDLINQHMINALRIFIHFDAQTAGSVSLRVYINEQNLLLGYSQGGRQVDGSGSLPYPTLLIGNANNSSHYFLLALPSHLKWIQTLKPS